MKAVNNAQHKPIIVKEQEQYPISQLSFQAHLVPRC